MSAEQIKVLRSRLGLTTTELAVAVGVTEDAVRKWEREASKPSGSALILLSQLAQKAKQPRRKTTA